MSKALRIRIFSFVLAAVLSFFGTAYSISIIASAADTVKTWNDWDEVGEDAIALKDAYVKYLREVGEGDFIGALGKGVDVPIKWLKLLSDGRLVLSPCDDIIYFLKDNVLQSTHKQGKEADTGLASRLKPVIDGKTGKQLYDYWSEYYKPHPNSSQYIYSYQSNESDVGKNNLYFFNPTPPVYVNNDWGKKQYWTGGVYVLPFYQDDDLSEGTLYSDRYAYFHTSGTSKEGNLNICLDIYNLSDNKLISSFSAPWDIVKYPHVSWDLLNLRLYRVILYPTYLDYMSGSNKKYLRPDITTDYGYFYGGKYVKYKFIDSLLQNITFTPDTNKNDDWGYIMSNEPFQLFVNQAQIDYDKIPDNYTITINGDTIYDYPITDPSTGKSTTINNYITNNYIIGGDDSGGGSGGDTTNNVWNIDFPDFITNITTSIETAITNVFVADVDVINNYNSELQDTFNKKLPFVNDFGDIFKSLFVDIVDNNFVYAGDIKPSYSSPGSEPDSGGTAEASGSSGSVREESIIYPKWTIDLSFFGKEMELTILDFSMYAEPLSYVRLIVCVFIYAVYFVNLMKYLPTLIGGVIDMGTGVYSTVNPPKKEKGGD